MDNDKADKKESIDFGSECDLHHFHPKETVYIVKEFIKQAHSNKLKKIRIVHGKGKSVKKQIILNILEDHPDVEAYRNDGYNWGATIVYLK